MCIRDRDYVVKDDEVLIVDEFTGRIMPGRRYSDGLHQAIEAKEHVNVRRESRTLATITFQNFFNKFAKKAGMTGTALTEEKEFRNIYGMDVIVIPTNRPVIRKDLDDAVYKTKKEKYNAVVEEVVKAHEKGQPVLVGTITIDVYKRQGLNGTETCIGACSVFIMLQKYLLLCWEGVRECFKLCIRDRSMSRQHRNQKF